MKKEFITFKEYHGLLVDDQKGTKIYGFENISEPRNGHIEIEGEGG